MRLESRNLDIRTTIVQIDDNKEIKEVIEKSHLKTLTHECFFDPNRTCSPLSITGIEGISGTHYFFIVQLAEPQKQSPLIKNYMMGVVYADASANIYILAVRYFLVILWGYGLLKYLQPWQSIKQKMSYEQKIVRNLGIGLIFVNDPFSYFIIISRFNFLGIINTLSSCLFVVYACYSCFHFVQKDWHIRDSTSLLPRIFTSCASGIVILCYVYYALNISGNPLLLWEHEGSLSFNFLKICNGVIMLVFLSWTLFRFVSNYNKLSADYDKMEPIIILNFFFSVIFAPLVMMGYLSIFGSNLTGQVLFLGAINLYVWIMFYFFSPAEASPVKVEKKSFVELKNEEDPEGRGR